MADIWEAWRLQQVAEESVAWLELELGILARFFLIGVTRSLFTPGSN